MRLLKSGRSFLIVVSQKHETNIKLMQKILVISPHHTLNNTYQCSKTHSAWFVLSPTCRLPSKTMGNHFDLAIRLHLAIRLPSKTNTMKNIKQIEYTRIAGVQTETYQLTTATVSAPGKRPADCTRSCKIPNVLFASDISVTEFRMG